VAKDVIMPVLGMNQDTAVLLGWLKREGDRVEKGEPIMEVETDKATMELDAPASGRLAAVRAAAGDEVKVGSVIAVILGEGEDAPAGASAPVDTGAAASAPPPTARTPGDAPAPPPGPAGAIAGGRPPAPSRDGPAAATSAAAASGAGTGRVEAAAPASGIVPASPKARRLAGEHGVALEALRGRGRGPEGAVLAADVMQAARSGTATASTGAEPRPAAAAPALRFGGVVAADALLDTLAWAQDHMAAAEEARLVVGDLVARFLAAVWSRRPLTSGTPDAQLRYRRVADGGLSDLRLPVAEAASLPTLAAARAAAATSSPSGDPAAAAEVALLDLAGMRSALAPESVTPAGALVHVVVGRFEERLTAVDGAPAAHALELTFAFDPARVGLAEAALFSDRVIALVEEPSALALLY